MKEALYNCCWNANYCSESCQLAHWPEHSKTCEARQTSTPAPNGLASPLPRPQNPTAPPGGTPTDTQTFVFAAPPPRPGSSGGHIILPHAMPPAAMATQQSPREVGLEPMLQFAESAAHAEPHPDHPGLDKAMSRIEHVPNEASVLGGHQASQHMTTLLLQQAAAAAAHSQHHQQIPPATLASRAGSKSSVISGVRSHPPPPGSGVRHPPPPPGPLYQPLMAQVVDNTQRDSSPHHTLPAGMPRSSSPASPEHLTVHNPPGFSWPYQQPVIISSTDGYPAMPLLQSSVTQQPPQHQSYFKAF